MSEPQNFDPSLSGPAAYFDEANRLFKKVKRTGKKKYTYLHKWTYNKAVHLEKETHFTNKQNQKVFKRGAIVYVDFGVNIGSEFSMPHFAVVLNKADNSGNEKLTVVPLTSKKHEHTIELSNTIQEQSINFMQNSFADFVKYVYAVKVINKRFNSLLQHDAENLISNDHIEKSLTTEFVKTMPASLLNNDSEELTVAYLIQQIPSTESALSFLRSYAADVIGKSASELTAEELSPFVLGSATEQVVNDAQNFSYVIQQYSKYNKKTYARLEDITTVSKRRIRKFNRHDPIGKIRVSSETLDIIEDGIKDMFFK